LEVSTGTNSKIPDSILTEKIAAIPRIGAKSFINNTNGVGKEHEDVNEVPKDENNVKKKKKKAGYTLILNI
jgi:hypothetical protein